MAQKKESPSELFKGINKMITDIQTGKVKYENKVVKNGNHWYIERVKYIKEL